MSRFALIAGLAISYLNVMPWTLRADEQKALDAIKKLGGEVERDNDKAGKPVIRVDLTMKKIKDADLALIKELKDVKNVQLAFTGVTDAGIAHLKDLPNLELLVLWETKVTDKGIKELKGSKKLKILNVKDTKVTEKGIADLKKALPNLDVIH